MLTSPAARRLLALITLLCCACLLAVGTLPTYAQGGIGEEGPEEALRFTPSSTINGLQISFGQEFGKTTIWLRVCANAPNFQLRSEAIGLWATEIFHRTQASGGCSPSTTSRWRMIYLADPGPQVYRIYATANDAVLPGAAFMQRAARTDCVVTAYGAGTCTPSLTPPPFSASTGSLDAPDAGQALSGSALVRGWAADAGSWNGTGVDQVQVWANGVLAGTASYGQARPDVAAAVGDARFTNSGFSYQLDTTKLTNGPATVEMRHRSTISGQWASISRAVTINNPTVGTPVQEPTPPAPDPTKHWNVPYFSQGNTQWGSQKIGACSNTIRNVGCALTSLTMIFQYYGANHNPGTLNGCFGPDACLLKWAGPRLLPCSGSKVTWVSWPTFSWARLEQELKSRPVILELRRSNGYRHFVVVLGGSGSSPSGYTVNDPGVRNGARTTLANTLRTFPGYAPVSMRLFSGTPAVTMSSVASLETSAPLMPPPLASGEVITGSVELNRNTEAEMVLELAAQSSAGAVTDMLVWTEQHPSEIWQSFSPFVSVPLDSIYYVRFRDAAGNTTDTLSVGPPAAPPGIEERLTIYLPLLTR